MDTLFIQQAMDQGAGTVQLHGWVYRERKSSKLGFLVLRDSSNIIQCVIKKDTVDEQSWDVMEKLLIECSVELTGEIVKDDRAPTGYEVRVEKLTLVGGSEVFPITKDQSVDFLAEQRHLWLRSRKMTAMLKIRSTVFGAIHEYFRGKKFYEFHSPLFQSTQAEGGSTLFQVDYFGKPIYLSQTWQLYAEAAIFSLENIYCIAPSFRAEKSKTSRHLTEYWHAEMEITWGHFTDVIDHGEAMIKFVLGKVLKGNKEELEILKRDVAILESTFEKPFVRMKYDEALKILKEKGMELEWGKDLRTLEEDELVKQYDTFVVVTHYPKKVKAFYMKEDPENPDVVFGCDFLAPAGYGEIIGGSEREPDLEKIKARLKEQGEDLKDYQFYLDTRKYGSVPHGGFGMGVERLVAFICGTDTIKDAIPFPRTMLRTTP